MSPVAVAFVVAVMVVAATVQASVGFGQNVVAAPLLALVDTGFVPGPLIVGALTMNSLLAMREHAHGDFSSVRLAIAGQAPGLVLGVVAVTALSENTLGLVLATVVLVAAGINVFGLRLPITRTTLVGSGFVSGFCGSSVSIGGPPMALLLQDRPGPALRATLGSFFIAGGIVSLTLLAIAGELGTDEAGKSAIIVPCVLLGFGLSRWVIPHVDAGRTRPAVLTISVGAAAALLAETIL